MTKPQRFKILRNADPDALAFEVSEHLEGIEHVDGDGFKTTYLYAVHGETRVVENAVPHYTMESRDRLYEQNVIVIGVSATVERVKAEQSATEAIQ